MKFPTWYKKHRLICAMINELQLEDAVMREAMKKATGKTSRADLSEDDQRKFITALTAMLPHDKGRPRGPRSGGNQIVMATADQKVLIQNLFFDQLGWDEARLNGFINRMSKGRAASLGTLAKWTAANIIEAGKDMHKRELAKGMNGQHSGTGPTRA